jgi:hypothetical protein
VGTRLQRQRKDAAGKKELVERYLNGLGDQQVQRMLSRSCAIVLHSGEMGQSELA